MAKPREQMRRCRQDLGHTQESFAELLGVPVGTYRDWERGVTTPRVGHRPRLARHLGVTTIELGWWLDPDGREAGPNGFDVPRWLGHFAALEQGAGQLWSFEPMVVPGLLQTPEYAAAVEARGPDLISEGEVVRRIELRLSRQKVLTRRPDPLALSVVIDESVLYRVAGDAQVMAAQLDRLLVGAGRPTIEVRVLPFTAGEFSAAFGSFTVLASRDDPEPFIAYVKDRAGPHYLDRSYDVETHARLFRYLQTVSLSFAASLDLIRTVAQERYR
jgi:transcriptional regulator with XRE-family HTH domain